MTDDWNINRRKALALIGAGTVGAVSIRSILSSTRGSDGGGGGGGGGGSSGESSGDGGSGKPDPASPFNIRDYGAAIDGRTDDTNAMKKALSDAAPDGTVVLPPGRILVDGQGGPGGIKLTDEHRNVTIRGGGDRPEDTILFIKPGEQEIHRALHIAVAAKQASAEIKLLNLTVSGNAPSQPGGPGFGISATEGTGTLVMRDCIVRDTVNAGLKLEGNVTADIKHCTFENCGDPERTAGHAINANHTTERTLSIENTLFKNSAGAELDIGDDTDADYQTVEITRCFFEMGAGAIKLDPGNKKTTIRNSVLVGGPRTLKGIKANNNEFNCGSLELDNVLIRDTNGPGVDIGAKDFDTLTLNDTALLNVEGKGVRNSGRNRTGAGLYAERADLDGSGRISIHGVGPKNGGDALWFRRDCSGSIEEIFYGRAGRLGDIGDVTVESRDPGGPRLNLDVVSRDDVGPRSQQSLASQSTDAG